MKKLIFILIFLSFVNLANAQWVQMSNGMGNNNDVYSLAHSENDIFAGNVKNRSIISVRS